MDNGLDEFEMTYYNNIQSVSSLTGMCTPFETNRKQIVRTSSVASPNPNTIRKGVRTYVTPSRVNFNKALSNNRLLLRDDP